MTLDELEVDPTSRITPTMKSAPPEVKNEEPTYGVPGEGGIPIFWVVGEDGFTKRMTWDLDGKLIDVDEFGWEY